MRGGGWSHWEVVEKKVEFARNTSSVRLYVSDGASRRVN